MKKVKDRNKRFTELVTELTPDYFGLRLKMGDFRKIVETYEQSLLEHLPIKERIKKQSESARLRDHSLAVVQEHYIQQTEKITISTDVIKQIDIIHEGKTYTFDIKTQILKL